MAFLFRDDWIAFGRWILYIHSACAYSNNGVISKIESGETKSPELRTLKPIADVLKIPYEDIIEYSIQIERRYGLYELLTKRSVPVSLDTIGTPLP